MNRIIDKILKNNNKENIPNIPISKIRDNMSMIRNIVHNNIHDLKILSEKLLSTIERVSILEESITQIYLKFELMQGNQTLGSSGVKGFAVSHDSHTESINSAQISIDLSPDDLQQIIHQHPNWLRPFAICAELQKKDDSDDSIRLIRSASGYMKVVRLSNGSEWSYIEPMKIERFHRIPMLKDIFKVPASLPRQESTVFVTSPLKVQPLHKTVLWEILGNGIVELDQS
jgi:hypothetical protein